MSERAGIKLSIRTKDDSLDLGTAVKMLRATRTMLREIERSITGKRPKIRWALAAFQYVCDADGCHAVRPEQHDNWRHTNDGRDYCPEHSPESES